jgi:hypothetical protein
MQGSSPVQPKSTELNRIVISSFCLAMPKSYAQTARSYYSNTPFSADVPGSPQRPLGGKFSKAERFYNPEIRDNTPGPIYAPRDNVHVASCLYKPPICADDDGLLHPSRDRSAWINGTTKADAIYFSDIPQTQGPVHNPNLEIIRPTAPRTKFSKNQRFLPLHIQYMGKELDKHGNISTASPGPQYFPRYSHSELKNPRQPVYSFGGEGTSGDRAFFLSATVKSDCFYSGRPATAERHVDAGPASYAPRPDAVLPAAPRAKFSKDERFKPLHILYMGKKLDKHGNISTASPGPQYKPQNYDLAHRILSKKYPNVSAKGRWCP